VRRREFITLIGGAGAAWPLAARAQQVERSRRIGVLLPAAADDAEFQARLAAFHQGLALLGWTIGRNVWTDTRWATANAAEIRRHAAELAALAPDVILAHGTSTVGPLMQATRTVPIVFPVVSDPVAAGFVDSLARPGGNVTGFSAFEYSLSGKWPELLKQIAPGVTRAAVLRDPAIPAGPATTTIPIVFSAGTDPVQAGLVTALNRPGGNVTGIVGLTAELGAKRLGLLHELLPGAARFAVLVNPKNRVSTETLIKDVQSAAATIGRQIEIFTASTNRDIDTAFASLVEKRADALMVGADPMFLDRRIQLATWAARYMLPAVAVGREFAEAGILMSYGASNTDRYRQVGIYAGRILKGEKPADLPVMQSTRFELVINVQTAKVLGLDIPPTMLARADEVIE
jgi:ABC-type uncharacterized transport system substrate-binding protein